MARQSCELLAVCGTRLARIVRHDAACRPANPAAHDHELALAHHGTPPATRDESANSGRGRTPSGAEDGSTRSADGWGRPRLQQSADCITGFSGNAEWAAAERSAAGQGRYGAANGRARREVDRATSRLCAAAAANQGDHRPE